MLVCIPDVEGFALLAFVQQGFVRCAAVRILAARLRQVNQCFSQNQHDLLDRTAIIVGSS